MNRKLLFVDLDGTLMSYDGTVSLEWVKRWNPDLEEPGIVFAHFMSYITFLMGRL